MDVMLHKFHELGNHFPEEQTIRAIYQMSGGTPQLLKAGLPLRALWWEVVEQLNIQHQLPNLPAAIRLISITPGLEIRLSEVERLLSKNETGPLPEITRCLKKLAATDNFSTVLLVSGERGSGKSHVSIAMEAIAAKYREPAIYISAAIASNINDLIARLFAALNEQPPGSPNTTSPAWYNLICSRLLAATQGIRHWIFFDDVHMMDSESVLFISQFVALMEDVSFRRSFRLILVDYPQTLPTGWPMDHLQEVNLNNSNY